MTFSYRVRRILLLAVLSAGIHAEAAGPGPLGGVLPGTLDSIGNALPGGTASFTDVYSFMVGPATDVSLLITLSAADLVNVGGVLTAQTLPSFSAQLFQGSPADPLALAVAPPALQNPATGGLSLGFGALSANASYFLQVSGSFPGGLLSAAYSGQIVAGTPFTTVAATVPEPAPAGLLAGGLLLLAGTQWRRARQLVRASR
jgi:hypothetical protein